MSAAVVTLGESVGLLTQADRSPLARHSLLRLGFGGAESNVAIGLARLGHAVHWFGRVGTDAVGNMIARELRAERVTTTVIRDSAPTGLMLKAHSATGRVHVTYYRTESAGSHLRPEDLDESAIGGARLLHVTGITPALGASAAAAVRSAVEIAQAHQVPVSLDLNFRSALWRADEAAPVLRDLTKAASVVFATSAEAALLVDAGPAADQADQLARLGPRQVVVKLGAEGAVASIDGELHTQSPVAVDVVDPVGAGDAFAAGYLSQLLRGGSPTDRLRLGGLTGALAVTALGDWEGMPHADDLDDLDGFTPTGDVRR